MWKNTSHTKYLILSNVRLLYFYFYFFKDCNKSCSCHVGGFLCLLWWIFRRCRLGMQMCSDEAGQRGRMWKKHGKFSTEMWKTSTTFSSPAPLHDLSRILTHNQTVENFSVSSLSWEIGFCVPWGLVFFCGWSLRHGTVGASDGLLVWHFGQKWNIHTTVDWIAVKFGINIHGHQTLNLHE